MHRTGKWLYASNIGHNSVVLFTTDFEKGTLTFVEEQGTGGKKPLHFGIEPSSKHLAISNTRLGHGAGVADRRGQRPARSPPAFSLPCRRRPAFGSCRRPARRRADDARPWPRSCSSGRSPRSAAPQAPARSRRVTGDRRRPPGDVSRSWRRRRARSCSPANSSTAAALETDAQRTVEPDDRPDRAGDLSLQLHDRRRSHDRSGQSRLEDRLDVQHAGERARSPRRRAGVLRRPAGSARRDPHALVPLEVAERRCGGSPSTRRRGTTRQPQTRYPGPLPLPRRQRRRDRLASARARQHDSRQPARRRQDRAVHRRHAVRIRRATRVRQRTAGQRTPRCSARICSRM